jgi:putative nucleotidyltransferase with HDIG domain
MGTSKEEMERITRLLPEVDQIQDSDIRRKVIEVWDRAWKQSTFKNIEDVPLNTVIRGYSLVDHTRCVTKITIEAAKMIKELHSINMNSDTLIAGALLHDVGKLLEMEMRGGKIVKTEIGEKHAHASVGAQLASNLGLPKEITHLIESHTSSSGQSPRTQEAGLLHYCDFANAATLYFASGIKPPFIEHEFR